METEGRHAGMQNYPDVQLLSDYLRSHQPHDPRLAGKVREWALDCVRHFYQLPELNHLVDTEDGVTRTEIFLLSRLDYDIVSAMDADELVVNAQSALLKIVIDQVDCFYVRADTECYRAIYNWYGGDLGLTDEEVYQNITEHVHGFDPDENGFSFITFWRDAPFDAVVNHDLLGGQPDQQLAEYFNQGAKAAPATDAGPFAPARWRVFQAIRSLSATRLTQLTQQLASAGRDQWVLDVCHETIRMKTN